MYFTFIMKHWLQGCQVFESFACFLLVLFCLICMYIVYFAHFLVFIYDFIASFFHYDLFTFCIVYRSAFTHYVYVIIIYYIYIIGTYSVLICTYTLILIIALECTQYHGHFWLPVYWLITGILICIWIVTEYLCYVDICEIYVIITIIWNLTCPHVAYKSPSLCL